MWNTSRVHHVKVSLVALLVCILLSGRIFSVIQPLALAIIFVLSFLALKLPRYRTWIETCCLLGLPLYCAIAAGTSSNMNDLGKYFAIGLCGSVYGLVWFGLNPESVPSWRSWTTAGPVLALAGSYVLLSMRTSAQTFHGAGTGSAWATRSVLAVAAVVALALWRAFSSGKVGATLNAFAVCSFGAALTLCLAIETFQNLARTSLLDIVMTFLPYVAAIATTLADRPDALFRIHLKGIALDDAIK